MLSADTGRIGAAIDKELDALPAEIETLVTESDLAELKRVTAALNKRILKRQMAEDPQALVAAIMRAKNGK